MEEKSNLYIVAIVGVVAVVALVILVLSAGKQNVVYTEATRGVATSVDATDAAGQAYFNGKTTPGGARVVQESNLMGMFSSLDKKCKVGCWTYFPPDKACGWCSPCGKPTLPLSKPLC